MTRGDCWAVTIRRLGLRWRAIVVGADSAEVRERFAVLFPDQAEILGLERLHPTTDHWSEAHFAAADRVREQRLAERRRVAGDIERARAAA